MRGYHPVKLWLVLYLFSGAALAGTAFKATTTLTAETSNNTSAADSFTSQTNGNIGATNVSKAPIRNLLYSGSNSKIYVNFLPWFGFDDHINVGYTSNDTTEVHKQVVDMVSRGVDGAIIDWFGQGALNQHYVYYDQASQDLMHEAELHPGFNFAIMDDAGSLKKCAATTGCDVTQTLINDLTYAYNTYENSSAYLRYNNQPLVYFFGHEAYTIDWTRVRTSVPGNPLFIFRNPAGFTYAQSSGAFSWIAPETVSSTDPMALNYLDYYDKTASSYPTQYSLTSGYKGFNDTLAKWGSGRIISQQCGQTWVAGMAENGKFYSSTNQMFGIQVVTWNDYEEGTEIESGIDNCVTISASTTGTLVSWSITGQVNTIDHYSVFISQDGENLMWLADAPASATSLDLAQFQLNSGGYTVFVKATGKPSMTNKTSTGVPITIPNQPPVAILNVSASSPTAPTTVTASTTASYDPDGSIASSVINFGDGSADVSATSTSHAYTLSGTYTITATVTDNMGASSSTSSTLVVVDLPPVAVLNVSMSSGIAPATASASTAGSSDPDGTIVSTVINFGDGSAPMSAASASHTYTVPGTYTITATVTDNSGTSASTSATVTVVADKPPVAALSVSLTFPTTPTTAAVSTSGSYDPDGTIASTVINFGDGSAAVSAASANHIYNVPGTYTITATVTDNAGLSSTTTSMLVLTADKPPTAAISVSASTAYGPATITASTAGSSDPDGTVAGSSINFGDGTSATGPAATHTYPNAGTYTLTSTVTDNQGLSSTATTTVTVKDPEVIVSAPASGVSATSPLHMAAIGYSGNVVTAMQIYVDGSLAYTVNSGNLDTTVNMAPGSHVVIVKGWDSAGRNFWKSLNVTIVDQPPVAVLSTSVASLLLGGSVTATTSGSYDPDGIITATKIDFGDGTVVNAASASHQYTVSGTYAITATVTDNQGYSSTTSTNVVVKAQFVSISSPTGGMISSSSVQVVGTANSGYQVTATQVWLDGMLKYQTSAACVNISLGIPTGTHQIVVQGWDASGATFKSAVSVTR